MYSLYIPLSVPPPPSTPHFTAPPFISPSHSPLFYQQHKEKKLLNRTLRVTKLGSSILYCKENRFFRMSSSYFPLPSSPLPCFS